MGQALQTASEHGDLDIASFLLAHIQERHDSPEIYRERGHWVGGSNNRFIIPNAYYQRALEVAAWHGRVAIILELLKYPQAIKKPVERGYIPYTPEQFEILHNRDYFDETLTVLEGHLWTKCFLPDEEAAYTNETPDTGNVLRILLFGCRGDSAETVEFALELGQRSALYNLIECCVAESARCGSSRVINFLIQKGVFTQTKIQSMLTLGVEKHSAVCTDVLLKCSTEKSYLGFEKSLKAALNSPNASWVLEIPVRHPKG